MKSNCKNIEIKKLKTTAHTIHCMNSKTTIGNRHVSHIKPSGHENKRIHKIICVFYVIICFIKSLLNESQQKGE